MSKPNHNLLISGDYPLLASPTLARVWGVASATFLQKLHYCLQSNDARVHRGKKYWFHSYEQWKQTLGIYSTSTIKRVVAKLKQMGIVVTEKLAQSKWVQTNFYTIDYKKLKQLLTVKSESVNQVEEKSLPPTPTSQPLTNTTLPLTTDSVQAVQPSVLLNSIQQVFQPAYVEPTTQAQPSVLKVAREALPRPDLLIPKFDVAQGLDQPLYPAASHEQLQEMPKDYRYFYQALRQQRVDIHYDDQRIQQLLKYQKRILQHIAYIKQNFGLERYKWHQLEQLNMERYLPY